MHSELYFLAALAIHEASHIFAGRVFFKEGIRVFFLPGGFHASWKSFQPDKWEQSIICAAGPIGNLIAAIIFMILPIETGIRQELVKANLLIGIFNLIPLYPMDGGSILLVFLYHYFGSNHTMRIMKGIGFGIRLFLLITGFIILFVFKNPSLFITIVFLPGIQSIKRSVSRLNLSALIRRKERILKKRAYPVRHVLVLKDVNLGEALLLLDYDRYHMIQIADHDLNILLQISEQQLISAIMEQNSGKTLEEVFLT